MSKVIYLSPSNHGINQNRCLKSGCYEDKHTRPIAEACAKYLEERGFEVIVGKTSQDMTARCKEANSKKADLYVPIHTNAAGETARYLLFMFWQDNETYRKIFSAVAPYLEDIYPEKKAAQFKVNQELYEVATPSAKTIYCELGFHTNKTDVEQFIHNSDAVGKALAKGICKYFGVDFNQESSGSSSSTSKKTIEQIAKEVIAGKWGNGTDREKRITAAGYNYDQVQAEVNKQLGVSTSKPKKTLKVGSTIKIKKGAKDLNSGASYASFVYINAYKVIEISGSRVVFGVNGKVTGVVDKSNVILV